MAKPSLGGGSKFKQGVFVPKNPHKYIGKAGERIIYRSSWELRICKWFDENESVLCWNSESVTVPYYWEADGKMHRYYVDFLAKMRKKDGSEQVFAIEVKPEKEMLPPNPRGKNRERMLQETLTYTKNQAKWAAARDFFSKQNVTFIVINEYDIGLKQKQQPRPKRGTLLPKKV